MYTSSCIVENKHFEVEENKVESYEDFIANLPLPIEELNHKTVRKYDLKTIRMYRLLSNERSGNFTFYRGIHKFLNI